MAQVSTIEAVADFFERHMQRQKSEQSRAAWQEKVQPRLARYAADLMYVARPYADVAQEEHTALINLCGEILTDYADNPPSPDFMIKLHEALQNLSAVSDDFATARSLLERGNYNYNQNDETPDKFWHKMFKFAKTWKSDIDEHQDRQDLDNDDPHKEIKEHLLDNFLGPAGPLLRTARELNKEYGDFFGSMWHAAKKRWRILRWLSVKTRRMARGIRASMLKLFKWLSRPLRNAASRLWNKVKKWGKKLLDRLPMGNRLRAIGGVAERVFGSKAFKVGMTALAGVGLAMLSSKAHGSSPRPAQVPDRVEPTDSSQPPVENFENQVPEFVPAAPVGQYLQPSAQMPWQENESDSPEGPFEFENEGKAQQQPEGPNTPEVSEPASSGNDKPKDKPKQDSAPDIDMDKVKRDLAKNITVPDAKKLSDNLEGTINEQHALTKEGVSAQQKATTEYSEASKKAVPSEAELKKKESDSGGFFSRIWNMLRGKTPAPGASEGGGGQKAQPPAAPPAAPPATGGGRSDGGDGSDTGGAAKSVVAKAPAAGGGSSGSVGGGENVERGKKATTRASGSVDLERVNPGFMRNFYAMVGEYNAKTGRRVQVNSGYRSKEQQAALRAKYGSRAAPPGLSMHEFGYAIDINSSSGNELDRMGLLQKYGFVRPVRGEAWHIEQAGTQANKQAIRAGKSFDIADRSGESPGTAEKQQAEREVDAKTAQQEEANAKAKVDKAKEKGEEKRKAVAKEKSQQQQAAAAKKAAVEQQAPNAVPKTQEPETSAETLAEQPKQEYNPQQLADAYPATQPEAAGGVPDGSIQVPGLASYMPAGRQEIMQGLRGNDGSNPLASPGSGVQTVGDFMPQSVKSAMSLPDSISQRMNGLIGQAGNGIDSVMQPLSQPFGAAGDLLNQGQGMISQISNLPQLAKGKLSGFLGGLIGQKNADALTSLADPLFGKAQDFIGQFTNPATQILGQEQQLLNQANPAQFSGASMLTQMADKLGISSALDSIRNPIEQMRQQIDPVMRQPVFTPQAQPDNFAHIESVGSTVDKTVDLPSNEPAPTPKQRLNGGSIDINSVPLYIGDMAFLHLNLGIGGR